MKRARFIVGILAGSLLVACGGGSGGSSGGTGELTISLTDATLYHYRAVQEPLIKSKSIGMYC